MRNFVYEDLRLEEYDLDTETFWDNAARMRRYKEDLLADDLTNYYFDEWDYYDEYYWRDYQDYNAGSYNGEEWDELPEYWLPHCETRKLNYDEIDRKWGRKRNNKRWNMHKRGCRRLREEVRADFDRYWSQQWEWE